MLKQEIDVVFQENEVMVLAVDNIKRLQVSIFFRKQLGILFWLNSRFTFFLFGFELGIRHNCVVSNMCSVGIS